MFLFRYVSIFTMFVLCFKTVYCNFEIVFAISWGGVVVCFCVSQISAVFVVVTLFFLSNKTLNKGGSLLVTTKLFPFT